MTILIFILFTIASIAVILLKQRRCGIALSLFTLLMGLMVGCGVVTNLLLANLQTYAHLTDVQWKSKNAIVILGLGSVRWSGDRIAIVPLGYSRVFAGLRLYQECKRHSQICTLILSGGDTDELGETEAEIMRRELVTVGVSDKDIILEERSTNTFTNAKFSSAVVKTEQSETLVVVSSGTHLRRAILYFSNFGVDAIAAPADQINARISWLPSAYSFFVTDLAVHEYMGIFRFHVYNWMGWNKKS